MLSSFGLERSLPDIRFLPPLSSDLSAAAPSRDGLIELPCFPLEAADNARIVPHAQGVVLLVSEPRYVALMESLRASSKTQKDGPPGGGCCVASQIARCRDERSRAALDASIDTGMRRGVLVRLKNLQRSPELNGMVGKLLYFNVGRGRWDVDVEDVGVRSLKQLNLEEASADVPHKPFNAWLSPADVGGDWQLAEVGVVLHLDKVEEVTTKVGKRLAMQKCTFSVVGRARIDHIRNPAAFAERSTFLWASVAYLEDKDKGKVLLRQEGAVLKLLNDVMDLRQTLTPGLSITPIESIADSLSARAGNEFWQLIAFWEQFLHAHIHAQRLRSVIEDSVKEFTGDISEDQKEKFDVMLNGLQKLVAQFSNLTDEQKEELVDRSKRKSKPGNRAMPEMPQPLMEKLRSLQTQAEGMQLSIFDRRQIDLALPLQQLIQAESHGERLQILEAALTSEKARLEAEDGDVQDISLPEALQQGSHYGGNLSKL